MAKLQFFKAGQHDGQEYPFADEGVRAGFPSPAQDYMENGIDLNHDLVMHPESTFMARVAGDSMVDADVHDGDIVVVDKALEVHNGDMAVCVLNGEFTLKYVELSPDGAVLRPANDDYPPITVGEGDNFEVWGVVTYVIHKVH
ncbi:MAG: translesion error-prone DNA polymerase V autoproteolytic subunit [Bacteroidales bacterium]|nr:translesion error-prone DNA polymerase V autoproteolytic subunit [Bacteroidales bacterium]